MNTPSGGGSATITPSDPEPMIGSRTEIGQRAALLRRTYREGFAFQWVREGLVNGLEAGATKLRYVADPASAEIHGLLRGQFEDDGEGMWWESIEHFVNRYGGGGKPIGGEHDNFGVGFKSSTAPWNKRGILGRTLNEGVLSIFIFGIIGEDTGLFSLPQFPGDPDTGFESVIVIDLDEEEDPSWVHDGIDWVASFPDWITEAGHGTTLTLLGDTGTEHTFFGDPSPVRQERSVQLGIWKYANERFWELSEGVDMQIAVPGFTAAPARGEGVAVTTKADEALLTPARRRTLQGVIDHVTNESGRPWKYSDPMYLRPVTGLRRVLTTLPTRPEKFTLTDGSTCMHESIRIGEGADGFNSSLPATAHVFARMAYMEPDGALVPPDLWTRANAFATGQYGSIAALYRDEIYDRQGCNKTGRAPNFGLTTSPAKRFVSVVVEPDIMDPSNPGVPGCYPQPSRSNLAWNSDAQTALGLPWGEWGPEFRDRIADEIPWLAEFIRDTAIAESHDDDEELKAVQDRVASLVSGIMDAGTALVKLFADPDGDEPSRETHNPPKQRKRPKRRKRSKKPSVTTKKGGSTPDPHGDRFGRWEGDPDGNVDGEAPSEDHDVPDWHWTNFSEDDETEVTVAKRLPEGLDEELWCPEAMFFWTGPSDTIAGGRVLCNLEHPIYRDVVAHWTTEYGKINFPLVEAVVQETYGASIAAYVAHTMRYEHYVNSERRAPRLSPSALTSRGFGFYGEHGLIQQKLSGKLGSTKSTGRKGRRKAA